MQDALPTFLPAHTADCKSSASCSLRLATKSSNLNHATYLPTYYAIGISTCPNCPPGAVIIGIRFPLSISITGFCFLTEQANQTPQIIIQEHSHPRLQFLERKDSIHPLHTTFSKPSYLSICLQSCNIAKMSLGPTPFTA